MLKTFMYTYNINTHMKTYSLIIDYYEKYINT